MGCFTKQLVRFGIIGALAAGAAVVVIKPHRIAALFNQATDSINSQLDKAITDPVALRQQIRSLEAEYPRRIEAVRGDLAQLREQSNGLQRDLQISQRVIALADNDLAKLDAGLAMIEQGSVTVVSQDSRPKSFVVVFKNEHLDVEEAYARRNQVAATRNAYASRAVDIERDLGYLDKQERQLAGLLTKLETERTNFQTQLFDLDRQIDAIARNERMIEVMEKRQETLSEHSRYQVASLDQLKARLADLRAQGESKLAALSTEIEYSTYEDRARLQIDAESIANGLYEVETAPERQATPMADEVIDVDNLKVGDDSPSLVSNGR